jgi:hypothetical protein
MATACPASSACSSSPAKTTKLHKDEHLIGGMSVWARPRTWLEEDGEDLDSARAGCGAEILHAHRANEVVWLWRRAGLLPIDPDDCQHLCPFTTQEPLRHRDTEERGQSMSNCTFRRPNGPVLWRASAGFHWSRPRPVIHPSMKKRA